MMVPQEARSGSWKDKPSISPALPDCNHYPINHMDDAAEVLDSYGSGAARTSIGLERIQIIFSPAMVSQASTR